MHVSFKDMIKCWMEISKIIRLHSFKYVFDEECMRDEIPYILNMFANNMLAKTLKENMESENTFIKSMTKALTIYQSQ
jgi:hypothetical protein